MTGADAAVATAAWVSIVSLRTRAAGLRATRAAAREARLAARWFAVVAGTSVAAIEVVEGLFAEAETGDGALTVDATGAWVVAGAEATCLSGAEVSGNGRTTSTAAIAT